MKKSKLFILLIASVLCLMLFGCERKGSEFTYFVNADGTTCTITGIGTYTGRDLVIPSEIEKYTVTGIGNAAFMGCSDLTSVTIPDSITLIGGSAFSGCSGLASITIPDSVTTIEDLAFRNCSGLTSMTIPVGVKKIGNFVFEGCSGLESVSAAEGNKRYRSAGNCLIDTQYKHLVLGCKNSIIPTDGSVEIIDNFAFGGCTGLTSVTIPASVTIITDSAFEGCTGLTSITVAEGNKRYHSAGNCIIDTDHQTVVAGCKTSVIPADGSVTGFEMYAFRNCTTLTSITIPDSIRGIGGSVFAGCTGLTSISVAEGNLYLRSEGNCIIDTINNVLVLGCKTSVIPTDGSVTSIGNFAFNGCAGLASITIPDCITEIGSFAFRDCTGLTSITIPSSVTKVGGDAFEGCSGLTSISVAEGNSKYHSAGNCLIDTEKKILVAGCKNSVIPTDGSVTSIGDYAFCGRSGLASVTIPDGVKEIGILAFEDCTELTNVTLPEGLTRIGSAAFNSCSELVSITIPDSVTSIGAIAFSGCRKLFQTENHVQYVGKWAIRSDMGITSVTLRKDTVGIGDDALGYRPELTSVTIPNGVKYIGEWAFGSCDKLESITIPDSVKRIGKDAFDLSGKLTDVYYGGSEDDWVAINADFTDTFDFTVHYGHKQ